jgi:membrane-associated phospholipid phosphatase
VNGADSPLMVDTLITNRDGIVGRWRGGGLIPKPLTADHRDNLELWGPTERASLCHVELLSQLAFSVDQTENKESITVARLGSGSGGLQSLPLVTVVRPTPQIFAAQLRYLDEYAHLRPDRAAEILAQLGHPTPFLSSIAFLHPERTRWTLELLYAAIELAFYVVMRFKHGLSCRRPHEYSPQVQPIIPSPRHGTLPSGHATESAISAYVLWTLISEGKRSSDVYGHPSWRDQLMAQAARIAINRTVAGVHFPVDSAAGTVLGLTLGNWFVSRCKAGVTYGHWTFDGSRFPADRDFYQTDYFAEGQQRSFGNVATYDAEATSTTASKSLGWMWTKALEEWKVETLPAI